LSVRPVAAVAVAFACASCSEILGLREPTLDNTFEGGAEASACGDTSTDPNNCGACGHSCAGSTCAASLCVPQIVMDNGTIIAPYDMVASDDGYLYFADGNSDKTLKNVARIKKDAVNGSPAAEILVDWGSREGYPNQIGVAGGNFFFAVDSNVANPYYGGGIVACPVAGCPPNPPITVTDISSYALTTDGTTVYYADVYTDGNFNDFYEIHSADTNLQSRKTLNQKLTDTSDVGYMDIDANGNLYWGTATGLYTCPASNCASPTPLLGALQLEVDHVRVTTDRVYFSSAPLSGVQSVQWVPLAGGTPTQVTSNVTWPFAIVLDGAYVYFTDVGTTNNPQDGRVIRCPRDGCGASDADRVVLSNGSSGGNNPRALTQDATYLYWGTYQGQIFRVAK
jgi:hypothetical protein